VTDDRVATPLLLALLDGTTFANAVRRSGKPSRVRLPDDSEARSALVGAHLRGAPSTLTFHAEGREPWREQVDAVALAAFCPAADGRCRWMGIDLDAADHGERGLVDPVNAVRALAERADAAGLAAGLLVARSRRGRGRHVFLVLPEPVALADAVIGVATLAAAAFKIAASDVTEYDAQHAFRRVNGAIARPGDAGAVELFPRSTVKPLYGWPLALPGGGAFTTHGGGVIVDPFEDRPICHECVPRCDHEPWSRFIEEARATLSKRNVTEVPQFMKRPANDTDRPRCPIDRLDARTRAFLDGCTPQGARNMSAFAASANLLGCGINPREAERLIVAGAVACGLPQREALDAFKSAVGALTRKQRRG
jgi:hypothetical protein